MEQIIKFCIDQRDFEIVNDLLGKYGWFLNPSIYEGRPLRLENSVVYHLVKYTPEEQEALDKAEAETEKQIVSIRQATYDQVDGLIAEGYTPEERYAKYVNMVKYAKEKVE